MNPVDHLEAFEDFMGPLPKGSDSVSVYVDSGSDVVAAIPNGFGRLSKDQKEVLAELQQASMAMQQASRLRDESARAARALNIPWELIAWSSGMSIDGAKTRWARESRNLKRRKG